MKKGRFGSAVDLDAAKNGSLKDLGILVDKIPSLALISLRKAFDVFVSHIDTSFDPHSGSPRNSDSPNKSAGIALPHDLILLSVKGLHMLLERERHDTTPSEATIAPALLKKWSGISGTLLKIYELIEGDREVTCKLSNKILDVLVNLGECDRAGLALVLEDISCQALVYRLWIGVNGDDPEIEFSWTKLLNTCFQWKSHAAGCMLRVGTVKMIGDLVIKRYNRILFRIASSKYSLHKSKHSSSYPNLLSSFIQCLDKESQWAFIEDGSVSVTFKHLQLLLERRCDEDDHIALSWDTRVVCRALRRDYIALLFAFSPYFQRINMVDPDFPDIMKNVLCNILPRVLTEVQVVKLMGDAVKRISTQERNAMAKSPFNKEWNTLEMLLIERYTTFRILYVRMQIRSCGGCGKEDIKTNLSQCSRCRKILYCSKNCQLRHWETAGHKLICEAQVDDNIRNHAWKPKDLSYNLAMQDIHRYFRSATVRRLRVPAQFNPLRHFVVQDYSKHPATLMIVGLSELLASYPSTPSNVFSAIDKISKAGCKSFLSLHRCERLSRTPLPVTVSCLGPVNLEGCYDSGHSALPHGRKSAFPRAELHDQNGQIPTSRRVDFVDYVLSFCGSTSQDYWRSDIGSIIIEHINDPLNLLDKQWSPEKILEICYAGL